MKTKVITGNNPMELEQRLEEYMNNEYINKDDIVSLKYSVVPINK